MILTGSEDGDMCVVEVPSGKILARTVYNTKAQRGINSIACIAFEHHISILVANCSVGADDKNLWYYTIDDTFNFTMQDAINLKVNEADPQVFNFDVVFGKHNNSFCFFCTTEEGLLWMGRLEESKIRIIGNKSLGPQLGAALATSNSGKLVAAAYDIYEFTTKVTETALQESPEDLR